MKSNQSKIKKRSSFLYHFVKITGAIPTLLWFRPKTIFVGDKKRAKQKRIIICANHKSFFDPIAVQCTYWNKTLHFLALDELFNTKTKNRFFKGINCIPVDRENFSFDSMREACDVVKSGGRIVIFPEGKLNSGENLLDFKNGIALIAHFTDALIVPIYIVPRKKWYNRSILVVGEPINVKDLCKEDLIKGFENASNLIRESINNLKTIYEKKKG